MAAVLVDVALRIDHRRRPRLLIGDQIRSVGEYSRGPRVCEHRDQPMPEALHVESADGTRIACRTSGEGPPLLLVHGSSTSSADWAFVAPLLGERFTTVAIDRRGRGASDDGPDYGIDREAEDVAAVAEAVGAELVVAHSYGALCAISAAPAIARLRHLVLYEPPIAIRDDRVELGRAERLVADGALDELLELFLGKAGVPADQVAMIRSSPAWTVLLDAVPVLPRELRAGTGWRPPAGPVEVETLFLVGGETDDAVYLEGLDDVQAVFPGARREAIPGQRHIAHVLDPAGFAERVAAFCGAP